MSRWAPREWHKPAPKKPPPQRGIKMKKSGSTWWGKRWVEALEQMSSEYSSRLARGRTYARAGRTHDLVIKDSKVTARVTGSRRSPYKVTITLEKLSNAVWLKAIATMAQKAQFSAELLAGQMPQEIDAAFKDAGASIFPVKQADLSTDCSCPDWANPCKHVAATHYVLGEALDRDPFLLFELRGRAKEQVLEALRAARAGEAAEPLRRAGNGRPVAADTEVITVTFGRIKAGDYDRLREPLPSLRLSFDTPPISGGVLRQLGAPAGWASDASPVELLSPMIRAAAERARDLAMAEPASKQDVAPGPAASTGRASKTKRASRADKQAATKKAATAKARRGPQAKK